MEPRRKLDVALSFMMADIALARRLYFALSETLTVFFFERSQEEITGRHGDEVFRTPFLEARVSVVLYRQGYGERGWTGVERTAIGEACLASGYRNLFVVVTDSSAKVPPWVPATHIYFSVEAFPEEQLIGAIRSKVLELGGQPHPMTAERRAGILKANQRYEAERKRFWQEGLPIMKREVAAVFAEVIKKVSDLDRGSVKNYQVGSDAHSCGIRSADATMMIGWWREGYGSIETDELRTEEYDGPMDLPGHPSIIWWRERSRPRRVEKNAYVLDLTRSRKHFWREKYEDRGRPAATDLSSATLADRLVIQFFDLVERMSKERTTRR